MDGIEFQIRPSGSHSLLSSSPTGHGSLDDRLRVGDEYRKQRQTLEATLTHINKLYACEPHDGTAACNTCISKKRQIKQAFYEYYMHLSQKGVQKPEDVERMFGDPEHFSLGELHQSFSMHLRQYLINDLCTPRPGEDMELSFQKRNTAQQLQDHGRTLQETLSSLLQWHLDASQGRKLFSLRLQDARSGAERIPLYIDHYCSILPEDTAMQRNFKTKYARIFESGIPHDAVVDAMRKEAAQANEEEERSLRHRLAELQMAQSAHLKNKRKKAERKDRRETDREQYESRKSNCSLEGCENGIDMESDETIQCALCDWLASKLQDRKHFYYCSVEHAEQDFDTHDQQAHKCFEFDSERCFYYPQPGPPGETEVGGICPDCTDHDIVSYFCSHECYSHNLETHRDEFHSAKGVENHASVLDIYRPAPDLQIVS